MKQKSDINKIGRSVNFKFIFQLMLFGMIMTGLMATQAAAFEIITEEDMVQKTVTKEDFIKTADNVIVLMDTSKSMNHRWQKDATKSKLEASKEVLTRKSLSSPSTASKRMPKGPLSCRVRFVILNRSYKGLPARRWSLSSTMVPTARWRG